MQFEKSLKITKQKGRAECSFSFTGPAAKLVQKLCWGWEVIGEIFKQMKFDLNMLISCVVHRHSSQGHSHHTLRSR